ncbi:zona pellucida-binding protein 1 [Phaethornis superciliosus]
MNYVRFARGTTKDRATSAADVSLGFEDVKAPSSPSFTRDTSAALRTAAGKAPTPLSPLTGRSREGRRPAEPLPPQRLGRPVPSRRHRHRHSPRLALRPLGPANGCREPPRWVGRGARGFCDVAWGAWQGSGLPPGNQRPPPPPGSPLPLPPSSSSAAPPAAGTRRRYRPAGLGGAARQPSEECLSPQAGACAGAEKGEGEAQAAAVPRGLEAQLGGGVQSSKRFLRSARSRCSSLKIVGSVMFPVKVYVKVNHSSPCILCMTHHLRNLELIDPVFQWNGPGGSLSSKDSNVQISPTGTLILRHFNLSGVYTCSIGYKLTEMQTDKNLIVKYLIYAYADPKRYYEFTAWYHAGPCNSFHNTSFEKALLQILNRLVAELSCEVMLIKSECHHIKMHRAGLQNVIFFTFSVACLDREKHNRLCHQSACDASHRLKKAKHLTERFFKQQVVARKSSERLSEIYYIGGTLQTVLIYHCYPGYGMNALTHPDCPECCVVCSPGSYNPTNGTHCLPCDRSLIYGATKC